jgi:thiamine kinase-like enzyme
MDAINHGNHLYESAYLLVREAGIGDITDIHAIKGGANNRVYRVENADRKGLLKVYFRHPSDPRNRLDAEFSFISFAWNRGIRAIPKPLACDRDAGIALYEWIEGRLLTSEEISEGYIRQVIDFFVNLNQHKEQAHSLDAASEACFSLREHMNVVEKRIDRLLHIKAVSDIDLQASKFVETELFRLWRALRISMEKKIKREGWGIDDVLPLSDRCLSPSDFGFHNALLTKSGELRFIDFEYAGWDDPAKTVCDFFCQPQVPVPMDYYDLFMEAIISQLQNPKYHQRRAEILFPLYQIKWCCIMLNDFSKTDSERRRFANDEKDLEEQKVKQLKKAKEVLKCIRYDIRRF